MFKVILVLSMVVAAALCACQNPPAVKNFNRQYFAGNWKIHIITGKPIYTPDQCLAVTFTGAQKYNVNLSWKRGGRAQSISGVENAGRGGVFSINLGGKRLKYVVLDTDYITYASVYTCDQATGNGDIGIYLRSTQKNVGLIEQKLIEAQRLVRITAPRTDPNQNGC